MTGGGNRARVAVTRAEAIAAAVVTALAAVIVCAYGLDLLGAAFLPLPMLAVLLSVAAFTLWRLDSNDERQALIAWAGTVIAVLSWLLWIARPSELPLATGPDLTHHLLLIHYLETHWRLVHDPSVEAFLGEMTYYTPGSHVLTSLAGAWTGTSGLRALHPLLAVITALKAGFVVLIARRVVSAAPYRDAVSVASALTLFASQTFFLGSFLEYGFVAQVVAELFLTFSWWTLTVWDQSPERRWLWMFALSTAALFLTWPVLVGPPLVLFGFLWLMPRALSLTDRITQAIVAGALPSIVAGVFMSGRTALVQMAGTGGKTAWPIVSAYGWPFVVVSTVGVLLALTRKRSRSVGLMAIAILTESAALYWLASRQHNPPYMALKLFYALLYVQACGTAVLAGTAASWMTKFHPAALPRPTALGWSATAVIAILALRSVAAAPRHMAIHVKPAITRDMLHAGEWARTHVPPQCIEYLMADDETAYWLHLAVLGNRRMSDRTGDFDTYALTPALVRWLTPGGLPYAIAEPSALPRDIREEADVISTFGTASIMKRRGPVTCPPTQ